MINGKSYYEILGVDAKAPDAVIKAAYRALASAYHPDKNPNNPDAEDTFKDISIAYNALKDDRAGYDRTLAASAERAAQNRTTAKPPSTETRAQEHPKPATQKSEPKPENPGFDRAHEKPGFDSRAARDEAQRKANLDKRKSGGLSKWFIAAALGGAALFALNKYNGDEPMVAPLPETPNTPLQTAPQNPVQTPVQSPAPPAGPQALQPGDIGREWRVVICTPQLNEQQMRDQSYIIGVARPQLQAQDALLDEMKRDPNSTLSQAMREGNHVRVIYQSAEEGGNPIIHPISHTFSLECAPGYRQNPGKNSGQTGYKARDFMFKPTSEFR